LMKVSAYHEQTDEWTIGNFTLIGERLNAFP
jgi:hypothetical protein